jgi:hypothetical protein
VAGLESNIRVIENGVDELFEERCGGVVGAYEDGGGGEKVRLYDVDIVLAFVFVGRFPDEVAVETEVAGEVVRFS